jgi:DNA polymerase-1
MFGHYLVDEDGNYGLDALSRIYTSMTPWKKMFNVRDTEKLCYYLCRDVDATWRCKEEIVKLFTERKWWLMREVLLPLGHELKDMEYRGVRIDRKALKTLQACIQTKIEKEYKSIRAMEGVKAFEFEQNKELNLSSPQDLAKLMEFYLKLPCIARTAGGAYSTGEYVLEKLSWHAFVQHLRNVRSLLKLKGTYVDGMEARLDDNNIIHTSYGVDTVTGRLNSSDPNLQNIPTDNTVGKVLEDPSQIKEMFIARDGHAFLYSDYAQAELRTLAMYSKDPTLIEAFRKGIDPHSATAAKVYAVELSQVSKGQRDDAKRVNFGIIYGRYLDSIADQFFEVAMQLERKQRTGRHEGEIRAESQTAAKMFWDTHHAEFPLVWAYLDREVAMAREVGVLETFFGRQRHFETAGGHEDRQAMNFKIQSTASDFTLIALKRCAKMLRELGIPAYPLLTVHDSILFEVLLEHFWEAAEVIQHVMTNLNFPFMNVPLVADMEGGLSWGALKKLDIKNKRIL